MKHTIQFDSCQDAADALIDFGSVVLDSILMEMMLEGASNKHLRWVASFGGVQGFPVTCWLKESRELLAAW
jgi:hypothetical protein